MNNYSLTRADRATHLKIVAVSLVAGILVIGVGLAARAPGGNGSLHIEGNAVTMNGAKPMNWSSRLSTTVR
jgi:hypothetical protein